MDFQLFVLEGRSSTTTIKLGDGVTVVGRQDDCQLRIKTSQVSRKHCELFEKKGLLLVKDLGSANGTFVNGKKIEEQRVLEVGDELMIGGVRLRVAKVGTATPADAPPAQKPSDTAVGNATASAQPAGDDFDIDFDDIASPDEDAAPTVKTPEPAAKPAAKPAAAKAEPVHEPEVPSADDAVADFLLDLNFDKDE